MPVAVTPRAPHMPASTTCNRGWCCPALRAVGQLVYVLGRRTQWEGLRPAIESGYAAGLVLQLNAGGDAGRYRRNYSSITYAL